MTGASKTNELSLEDIIVRDMLAEGWLLGSSAHYSRQYALDLVELEAFLRATQKATADAVFTDKDGPTRRAFLARLQGEISKRGIIDVLRRGVDHGPHHIDLFYGRPSPGNTKAAANYAANRFVVTRQLKYSLDETKLALDLMLGVNGLPVKTFELKNSLTKQTTEDAVQQYKRDRDPRELLFQFGRCVAHFAVDDQTVQFCTELRGAKSWFLPFNKGFNDGAGNPPNPNGLKTDYLWKEILSPDSLTDIIEHYAQVVTEKDAKTGKTLQRQIFPRYHQLDVVRRLLADAERQGIGHRYLIQAAAGGGKSNAIGWLAHEILAMHHKGEPVVDTAIVVTDRKNLDKQIKETVKQFAQVRSLVGHAESGADLKRLLSEGKRIIITTVQKFPVILDEIGAGHRGRRFALIIDEAHSSQGGKSSSAMNAALSTTGEEEDDTVEDRINRVMEGRKLLRNANYYAFTATPKNKTLETFGEAYMQDGHIRHRPFHSYTMKQAIQEGFILDVLANYTPVESFYRLVKTIEDDPEFDVARATRKLKRYVEGHSHAIRLKAEIMVDHFLSQVVVPRKVSGEARGMVVTRGVIQAIEYFMAIRDYLREINSPIKPIIAFAEEHEYKGQKVTEASLNGFPSNDIETKIREDPYRLLICADKFQTGYDEPLLAAMYIDKPLAGIKAVQTLSRLNRARPDKKDVIVLDFANDSETIRAAFNDYYRTTILSDDTNSDKLHDLKASLDAAEVYDAAAVDGFVSRYLMGAERDQLDPILDACVATYIQELDEDEQVSFKGQAKAFVRTYAFLSALLPYSRADWEKLSIFLSFLVLKLPAPREDDETATIAETVDMDSYRVEKQQAMALVLEDADAEIGPVPTAAGGRIPEPEVDRLSAILQSFNDLFGNIPWTDKDRVHRIITQELPAAVASDKAYRNAIKNNDKQNAKVEHDKALQRAMVKMINDNTELFKQFSDNADFRRWVTDKIFEMTYEDGSAA